MRFILVFATIMMVAAAAFGMSLCDYHTPHTSLSELNLAFSYRYSDTPDTPEVEDNSGRIGIDYSGLFDSPEFGYTLSGMGEIRLSGFALVGGLGQGSGTMRYYLSEDMPVFGFGGADSSYTFGEPSPALNVSIGVGYGRFTDVTPLAKAYKIEDDLLALGAISAPLTDETLMAVATEIGKRVEYATIKDLVAAVEPIIEQDAGVTLNARALLTIEDDILATGDSVHCGWSVQAGVGYEVMDPYGGKRDPIFTISGDAALAPMPDSQLSLHAGMYGPFDIMNENTLTMNASYKYAIKSDVDLNLAYQYRRVLPEGQTAKDSQSASAILKFDLGGADVSVQLGLSKGVEATAWSKDITIAAGMSLF